jgi:AAA domain (dynein-related subfamily)
MPDLTFADFLAQTDWHALAAREQEAALQRHRVISLFPREQLITLSMEDYASGEDLPHDTLAKMLAVGSPALGDIRGVGFNQVRIFRLKGTGLYKSTLENAGDAAADWVRLRAALVECCRLADAGEWDAIDRVSVSNWIPALRTKLLHLYFPDDVLPICVQSEIVHFIDALGINYTAGPGKWAAAPNRRLLEHLRCLPELAGRSPTAMALLLREWAPKGNDSSPLKDQREAVLRAISELRDIDPTAHDVVHHHVVRQYVMENFDGMDIKDCGTVMNDMVSPALGGNPNSRTPMKYRLLERVRPGEFRLIADPIPPPPSLPMPALNQILYGPPGTGKTYNVIRRAAMIVTGRKLDDAEAKQVYDEQAAAGRIRLATFHQSFSYEDFIEGIRPVMDDEGAARFEVRDGVFKEIALEAMFECLKHRDEADAPDGDNADPLSLSPANVQTKRPKKPNGDTTQVWEIADTLATELNELPPRNAVIDEALKRGINKNTALTQWYAWHEHMSQVQGQHQARHREAYAKLKVELTSLMDASQDTARKQAKDYLANGPASGWQLRPAAKRPPFVLIIDEINRGNISRIFGELITLIEDDKRHGEANALTVTLPTSRESFSVPPNLFLLGTMNTADKSLALLDIALRRRFEFDEIAPDFTRCSGFSELQPVMDELNLRLELRKDRDHRIGHAFFMGVTSAASFNAVFRRKVVPLLQEYFFNDIDGARYVLGEADRTISSGFLRPLKSESKWQRQRWRWFTDVDCEMDCWTKLKANYAAEHA